ncbi:MAG: HAD family hydrolase [Turicibacter sp.]|nr:HAD family hydrolase [Turicibacter sp.]
MIKLVAADMDGTLLNSKKELSDKLFPTIDRLHQKRVKFAVASGRQYYNLLEIYESLKDEMIFIAENGAIVFDEGRNIFYDQMETSDVLEMMDIISKIPNAFPILCGLESAYIDENNGGPQFEANADMYYARCQRVSDLKAVVNQDAICKIAIYTPHNSEQNIYPFLEKFYEHFKVVVSAGEWVDIMNKTVNKGHAIKMIQEKYGISYDETMAFGDYLNDYEMMESCHYSYAMANGHPDVLEVANFKAPSNDEDGVVVVLEEFLQRL